MNIIFIGGMFSSKRETEIVKKTIKGSVQYAANNFQWNIINGFLEIGGNKISIVSAPFIGTYPKEYKEIYFNEEREIYKNEIETTYVSFLNVWAIRNIFRKKRIIRELKKKFKINELPEKILVYSAHTPFLQAALKIKQKNPSLHICLIVPDIPEYMNLDDKKSFLYKILKKIDIFQFNSLLKKVDSFVLITEKMKEPLKIDNKPYVVVEGIIDGNMGEKMNKQKNLSMLNEIFYEDRKYIVYTGTLREKFGIINLIKAFMLIKNTNLFLVICGTGDISEKIRGYIKRDNRIIHLGQISNVDAKLVQNKATILVNPRPNDKEFTKYSFPYKTLEYLLTGNPVVAFKLDGIPNEYDEFLYYIPKNNIESIKDKIIEVLNIPEHIRDELGKRAEKFILFKKNPSKVCTKILNIMK